MKRHQLLKMEMRKLLISIAVLAVLSSPSCSTQADHCTGHNVCLNEGTCVNGTSGFSCACAQGFTGNHCEINIDNCAGHSRCLNGGTCVDGASNFTCACAGTYFGNHCEHQNECVYPGTCSSLSTLSRDAKCKCREGYAPDPHDSRRCEPVDKNLNENATLIFGSIGEGIEQFSLSQQMVTRIQNHSFISFALDVLYRTNTMFWSDVYGNINAAPIRQGAGKTVVLNDPGSSILSLAVDWVYGHLYFSDRFSNTISVANLYGSMRKDLNVIVTETSGIVVDPLSGWIYWTDVLARNIKRAALDGSQGEIIANTEPKQPNGLALDMTQNRLYWTARTSEDLDTASIHSMNVDGSDQKIVFQATPPTFPTSSFSSITTSGDFVYWREYFTKAIYRTNKCGGGEATLIYSTDNAYDEMLTLQAYHFSKQPEGVNYCKNRIGGQCSHFCFRIPSTGNQSVATTCACPDGHTLSSDKRTCYAPDSQDGRRCEPVDKNLNENATLIFGRMNEGIEQFLLSQQTVTRIQNHSSLYYALDVMYRTNTMFWSDTDGNIWTAPIREGAAKTVVLSDSGALITSLAVDWLYGHLYFADSKRDTISVANLNGSMKKVLLTTRVSKTHALVVDPLRGWIYWSDGNADNIERAVLDGSQRKVLTSTKPWSLNGLALDMTQNQLYWTTGYLLNSMNVDGSEQKQVFRGAGLTFEHTQFWSITTFGDFVYWRDLMTKGVYRTNKCGGGGATKIHTDAYYMDAAYTFHVYHVSKQPEGVNYCENRIGGQCSHLCFRIPSTGNNSVATNCACPDGLTLSSDQRTCT